MHNRYEKPQSEDQALQNTFQEGEPLTAYTGYFDTLFSRSKITVR